MSGVIRILGLRVPAHVGVTEEERAREQTLVIDVEIHTDLRAAAESDDLVDTVDYDLAVEEIAVFVGGRSCALLEHLASALASHLAGRTSAERVSVEVAKAAPPVRREVERISVRIEEGPR